MAVAISGGKYALLGRAGLNIWIGLDVLADADLSADANQCMRDEVFQAGLYRMGRWI